MNGFSTLLSVSQIYELLKITEINRKKFTHFKSGKYEMFIFSIGILALRL